MCNSNFVRHFRCLIITLVDTADMLMLLLVKACAVDAIVMQWCAVRNSAN